MTASRRVAGRRWLRRDRTLQSPALSGTVALALCALALSVAACGIPYDSGPQSVPDLLPPQLSHANVATPQTTLPVPSNGTQATFYFVQDSHLQPFTRKISKPAKVLEILQDLEHGPWDGTYNGRQLLGTDVPSDSQLSADGIVRDIAEVGLDSAYYQLPSTEQQIFELAQIVYTLQDSLPALKGVTFYDGHVPAVIFNGFGQTWTGPVNETTYCLETIEGCTERTGHRTS